MRYKATGRIKLKHRLILGVTTSDFHAVSEKDSGGSEVTVGNSPQYQLSSHTLQLKKNKNHCFNKIS